MSGARLAAALAAAWTAAGADPKIASVFPMSGRAGSEFDVTVRGTGLDAARAVMFDGTGVVGRVIESKPEEARVRVTVEPGVAYDARGFRIVTSWGVTNRAEIRVTDSRTASEDEPVASLPALINGVLSLPGETDSYWIGVAAGETIGIEAISGLASFDPAVSVWAPSASWFDKTRLERIAVNDEPLYFPGLDTAARLTHRFDKAGKYCVRVSGFQGQGGPGYVYQLRIARGALTPPKLHPVNEPEWPERSFVRRVGPEWMAAAARRGLQKPPKAVESYKAALEGAADVPVIDETGMVEGRIGASDEAHEIRLKIAETRDLAIEVETPGATLPRFNPVVRVMQPDGHEVVTNVYTKRNNNGLYMMKMIQAKTVVTLRSVGEYRIQIRDITSDRHAPDFAYRVLIRPRIPHIGSAALVEDRVNLEPGQSKPLTVNVDREEGFKGFVAISVEGLPPGITAVAGLENPVERPPLPNAGRRERYYPVPQTATVMLIASPDAPPGELPSRARVIARPVVDGRVGEAVLNKEVPVMVVARRPS